MKRQSQKHVRSFYQQVQGIVESARTPSVASALSLCRVSDFMGRTRMDAGTRKSTACQTTHVCDPTDGYSVFKSYPIIFLRFFCGAMVDLPKTDLNFQDAWIKLDSDSATKIEPKFSWDRQSLQMMDRQWCESIYLLDYKNMGWKRQIETATSADALKMLMLRITIP